MKKVLFISICLLAILSCTKNEKTISNNIYTKEQIKELPTKIKATDFTLSDISGNEVKLSDFRGKVILLNFWAQWCAPCIEEMPYIENLNTMVKENDIKIITINVGENKKSVKNYLENNNFTFISLLDGNKKVTTNYSVKSIPTTYIIDKDGYIVASKLGSHKWDSQGVVKILKELNNK